MPRALSNLLILIAFTLNSVYFLVACQPKKGTQSTTLPGPAEPSAPGTPDSKGTSDQGGGGNLINGKPLDFYKKDITQLSEYIKYIQPIDEKITSGRQGGDDYNEVTYLATAAKRKTWYVVPVKLDQIEAARIGTNFQSEQGAYQTNTEVFISDVIYKTLDEEHKAQLLLHEVVMAFYLIKYEDGRFYCEAFKKASVREMCLGGTGDSLNKDEFKPAVRQDKFLSPDEYESIRHVTEWLYSNYKTMTKLQFEEKMVEKKFDRRVFHNGQIVSQKNEEQKPLPIKEFLAVLEAAQLSNQLPSHCGFDFSAQKTQAKQQCKVAFSVKDETLTMTLQSDGGKSEVIPLLLPFKKLNTDGEPDPTLFVVKSGFRNGSILYNVRLTELIPSAHGTVFRTVIFWLNRKTSTEFSLNSIGLQKHVWLKNGDNDNSLSSEEIKQSTADDVFRLIFGNKEADISIHELY